MNEKMKQKMMVWVVISLVVGAAVGYLGARMKYRPQIDKLTQMVKDADKKLANEKMMVQGTGYVMKGGKMMVEVGGKMAAMTKDVMLTNGEVVMVDGTIIKPDGTKMQLKEGQSIWSDGTMMEGGKMMEEKMMK